MKSDFINIGHIFYTILLWIIIITIYVGPLLHFTSVFFIAVHILFYYILRITIYVNFITFYVSYYISHQIVIAFYVSITFHVIIAIYGSTTGINCGQETLLMDRENKKRRAIDEKMRSIETVSEIEGLLLLLYKYFYSPWS